MVEGEAFMAVSRDVTLLVLFDAENMPLQTYYSLLT